MRISLASAAAVGASLIVAPALAQGQAPPPLPAPTAPAPGSAPPPAEGAPPQAAPPPPPAYPQPYPQPYPSPYPYPYYYPYPPPSAPAPYAPPPKPDPTARVHDGFFFQLASGMAVEMVKIDGQGTSLRGRSTGGALDLAFGGTVASGLVVAGTMGFHSATMRLERDGVPVSSDTVVRSSLIGAMLAFYPDPRRGLFVQGGLGFATVGVDDLVVQNAPSSGRTRTTLDASNLDGFGGFVAAGHEWFVSEQWSVGLAGRIDALWAETNSAAAVEARVISPSVRVTLTFHLHVRSPP